MQSFGRRPSIKSDISISKRDFKKEKSATTDSIQTEVFVSQNTGVNGAPFQHQKTIVSPLKHQITIGSMMQNQNASAPRTSTMTDLTKLSSVEGLPPGKKNFRSDWIKN